MESKKLNVTEEWLQVITELTLGYRRNMKQTVKEDDQKVHVCQAVELLPVPSNVKDIKQGSRIL